ncbi:MAG: hypothetical protein IMF00_04230 [Proteobacteria bacterium]|jgi:hypothetical protein|nr:hypothetical protein [Pseudomonadota bacterium]
MFKFKETFDRLMTAITFAEAGEHETALDIMHDKPEKRIRKQTVIRIRSRKETRPRMRI